MTLEKEYVRRIMIGINTIDGLYELCGKLCGVKDSALILLYALDGGGFHTQKSICEEWLIPRTTLNTTIKECEAKGYITLHRVPKHKRDLHILLTDKGRAYAAEALAPIYDIEHQAIIRTLSKCSPDFIDGLEQFARDLKEAFAKAEETLT